MTTLSTNVWRERMRADLSARSLLVGLMVLVSCLYLSLARDSYMNDFRAYYVAVVAAQDHLDPYVTQVNVSEKYADGMWVKGDSRFVYPPTALLFFTPFGHLPYSRAKLLYAGMILLAMIGLLSSFQRLYPRQTIVLLMLFVSLPMFAHIDTGQVDVLILALLLGAFYLKDGWRAGLCLGVAIMIKLAPVIAVLWFLGNRRWRTIGWSVVTGVGLALAVVPWLGLGLYREFLHHLLEATRQNHHLALVHRFEGYRVIGDRLIMTPDGLYEFWHVIYQFRQNPLFALGRVGLAIGLLLPVVFMVWVKATRRGRRLSEAQSYFIFLVMCLFANLSLWPMGLLACFPLLILLVDTSRTPNRTALLLLSPFFMTQRILGGRDFAVFVVVAVYCIFENGWLRGDGGLRGNGDGVESLHAV